MARRQEWAAYYDAFGEVLMPGKAFTLYAHLIPGVSNAPKAHVGRSVRVHVYDVERARELHEQLGEWLAMQDRAAARDAARSE